MVQLAKATTSDFPLHGVGHRFRVEKNLIKATDSRDHTPENRRGVDGPIRILSIVVKSFGVIEALFLPAAASP